MNPFNLLSDLEGAAPKSGGWQVLVIYIVLFVGLWFLMIAPQKKRQKQHKEMLDKLSTGTKVVTTSGIIGTVANIKNNVVVLKVGESTKIEVFKSYIQCELKDGVVENKD